MHIKNLKLKNFRNYVDETVTFTDGLNVLYGKNAQGKTNCAEAVFYLCTGVSPRSRRDKQLIRHGCDCAEITGVAEGRYGEIELYAKITENGREVRLNGGKITKNADVLGNIYGIFFSPHELRLIQDGPDERRRFLNLSISQLSKSYYIALSRYNKILEQRNNLLKDRDLSLVFDTLPVWDEQFARYAAQIAFKRAEFINALAPVAKEVHGRLTDGAEELTLSLDKKYSGSEKELESRFLKEFGENRERDVRLGFTASGPHRDDLYVEIDGTDAKSFASQGQARTAALSLKLAEVEIFKRISAEAPVLVLDDVMSELDLQRRKQLVGYTQGLQTIITCTRAERVLYSGEVNTIRIEGGRIKK